MKNTNTSSFRFFARFSKTTVNYYLSLFMQQGPKIFILLCLFIWTVEVFYWSKLRQEADIIENNRKVLNQSSLPTLVSNKTMPPLLLTERVQLPPVPEHLSANRPRSQALKVKRSVALPDGREANEAQKVAPIKLSLDALKIITDSMLAMDSKDIRFLLPRSKINKERFLKHMYRCENMQFGAISNRHPSQLSLLSKPSKKQQESSQLLRIAHDYLNKYEHDLMKIYAQQSLPVRIFTAELDVRLAQHIAINLNGKALSQLSGRYFVNNSKVGLKEVVINNKKISKQWVLSKNPCLSL